jgi:hypothetical protein
MAWKGRAPGRKIDQRRLREFSETGERLARERAAAEHNVTELLESTPPDGWSALAERAAFQTCGALETLGRMVTDATRGRCDPPAARSNPSVPQSKLTRQRHRPADLLVRSD